MSSGTDPALRGSGLPAKIAGYRLDGYVGQGGMAVVYRAVDERLHRQVALKVLAPSLAGDAAFSAKVIRDSRAAAAVDHPHIIPVYEAGEAEGTVYVAMRYASAGDARSLLNRRGPLPAGFAWRIIAGIASALDAAHAHGLVHCDVRPANILLDHGSDHAYLSDFGMSREFSPGQVIAAGEFAGTLDYMAPERIEGRVLDGRADQYSLACAGFELLCGTPPFGQDRGPTLMYAQLYAPPPSVATAHAELPAAVDAVLARALTKNPAGRYPSCGQFAEELRSALGLRPGAASGPRPPRSPGGAGAASAVQPTAQPAAAADAPTDVPKPARPHHVPKPARPHHVPKPARHHRVAKRARPPRLRRRVLAAAVVLVAAAVAIGVAASRPSAPGRAAGSLSAPRSPGRSASTASPAPAPSTQAAAVGALLASSAATRTALRAAVRQAGACTNLSGAVSGLQDVVDQRAAESRRASALVTAALPDGTAVKSDLIAALGKSLQADRDYLTWARQQLAGGCAPPAQSGAFRTALSANQAADQAKQAFARVWNRVAPKYGIKPIRPDDF